ncbi:unnamed protein product [Prorocentrum cordatum]|uniref:Uncharacterized protein n=1 Tax=Prorocentrum cordatum TaxID=2364126 RepID=A0ABN9TQS1_9DINO|nr:unnamed protein product [Polarella glacialis]
MPVRIWAAAAALLAPAAEGLAAQAFLGAAVVEPDATPEDGMRSWLERAEKANEGLDEELRKVMSELASTARQEKDPRTKKEQQLQMLEDLLKQYDTENETSIDETSKRMAAIAFRKAIRNHIRKPHRKSGKADTKPGDAVDRKMADEFSEWVQEANRATHDLEKQLSADESDLGLPKPKSAEEKSLDRVADLIDEVDPKNASEMADLGEALAQERRPKQVRKAKRHARSEPTEEDARMVEAMKEWVLEADKASRELERSAKREESDLGDAKPKGEEERSLERVADLIDEVDPKNASEIADLADALAQVARHEESDLGDAKPKGEEEKSLERVADLIDEVDPKNASEMAELADALAQVQRPKRKAARHASQSLSEADSTIVEAMRSWIAEANKASQDFEREARHEASDLGDAKPKGEEEKSLERVADLIDEVDPKNASEMADLADALAQVQRPKRKAARHASQAMSEVDAAVVEAMKNWMAEAVQASQDFEREARHEASDLGDAKPKGEEEKSLERVADLIDGVDPKNASELADLGEALSQRARTLEGKLAPRSDPPTEPARPVADEARRWMAEADQATSDIDREIDEAIDELIAGPKSAEERELERIQRLIDSTDPENATDVADLAASLATSSSFTRRVVKFPADWKVSDRSSFDWSKDQAKKFWAWLKKAEEESEILDQDLDASEAEFQDYLKNMTSAQQSVMHMGLKALEEMWEKYDFDNETATAEDVMERVQLHRVRRTQ